MNFTLYGNLSLYTKLTSIMKICKNIIKITSMLNIFKKRHYDDSNVIITVQNDMVSSQHVNQQTCNYNNLKLSTDIIYKLFVSILLSWPIILMLVFAIIKKDIKYITSNLFQLLPITQYVIGLFYYRGNHCYECLKRNIDNIKYIVLSYVLALVISLGIFISIIILMACNSNLSIFRELTDHTNTLEFIFVIIFTALHSFYSYLVILVNVVTFGSIFIMHSIEISRYYNKLNTFIDTNSGKLSLESVTMEHAETKSYHSASVKKMNILFSSITIIGFIGSYYVILYYKTKFSSIYNYMFLAAFITIELLYVYSIHKVKNAVSDMSKLMSSEKVISRYLTSVSFKDMVVVEKNENGDVILDHLTHIVDIVSRTSVRTEEIMRYSTWHTLREKLSEEWECFNICGFDIDDATILNKIITIVVGVFMLSNLKNLFGL